MTGDDRHGADADVRLDPWCIARMMGGEHHLFGFADRNPVSGGLAWRLSSELLEWKAEAGTAWTSSGRFYLLGRRFYAIDVGGEGAEARAAFELLLGGRSAEMTAIRAFEVVWISACKAARHLGLDPPPPVTEAVRDFMDQHGADYVALRKTRGAS